MDPASGLPVTAGEVRSRSSLGLGLGFGVDSPLGFEGERDETTISLLIGFDGGLLPLAELMLLCSFPALENKRERKRLGEPESVKQSRNSGILVSTLAIDLALGGAGIGRAKSK